SCAKIVFLRLTFQYPFTSQYSSKPVNTEKMATNEIPVHQSKLMHETRHRFARLYEAMKEKRKACPIVDGINRLMAHLYNLMK
ncbi:MAG TPA: hypothetical protein PK825_05095, partial [Bacteroidales bacterium]|nr:hypothetical protein [Bacteroidales bacterium]